MRTSYTWNQSYTIRTKRILLGRWIRPIILVKSGTNRKTIMFSTFHFEPSNIRWRSLGGDGRTEKSGYLLIGRKFSSWIHFESVDFCNTRTQHTTYALCLHRYIFSVSWLTTYCARLLLPLLPHRHLHSYLKTLQVGANRNLCAACLNGTQISSPDSTVPICVLVQVPRYSNPHMLSVSLSFQNWEPQPTYWSQRLRNLIPETYLCRLWSNPYLTPFRKRLHVYLEAPSALKSFSLPLSTSIHSRCPFLMLTIWLCSYTACHLRPGPCFVRDATSTWFSRWCLCVSAIDILRWVVPVWDLYHSGTRSFRRLIMRLFYH